MTSSRTRLFASRRPSPGQVLDGEMSLIIHDEICLNTEIGVCKIQLCIGDITKLPKEESVDVLVVSAFPGKHEFNYVHETLHILINFQRTIIILLIW